MEEGDFVFVEEYPKSYRTELIKERIGGKVILIDGRINQYLEDLWHDTQSGNGIIKVEDWFLILSFSTCLAWLMNKYQHHMLLSIDKDEACHGRNDEKWWFWFDEYHETQQYDSSETHHEAICKCVIKVLEAQDE